MKKEAALFKVLSDPIRLRLVILLAIKGETCVCMLSEALDEPSYKISRHLGILKAKGVVDARRDGSWMNYCLTSARSELEKCLQECFHDCLNDHPVILADLKRLKKASCKKKSGRDK